MGILGKKLSTEPYKGVRDFYPEDMYIQRWMFGIMRKVVESFGYTEYDASVLEPSELYRAKSGEEIANEQTYNFKDRGGREVTLRPEMTPTLARMIAARERGLAFPLRWYSIPNVFRYENPQRGRLREHWQLNVDVFGISNIEAEIEVISIASLIMKNLGAKDSDFVVKINSRKLINELYALYGLDEEKSYKLSKLIDKKDKISMDNLRAGAELILGNKASDFLETIGFNKVLIEKLGEKNKEVKNLVYVIESLSKLGIKNVLFTPSLLRGFDYYTGFVFEVFDTNPTNSRSLFGGGRYDELLEIFGKRKIPATGFGMGDVTTREFLKTRNLLPTYKSPTDLYICVLNPKLANEINAITERLRQSGVWIAVDWSERKIGEQIKTADKQKIPFVVCIGENEIKNGEFKVKELLTGKEKILPENEITEFIKGIKKIKL